ncbi:MAG: dipeptidase [Lentilitoribacter sp.]
MLENHLPLIFDGHNDLLFRLYDDSSANPADSFLNGRAGHIDLPKAQKGGFGGGFFAIYVPSPDDLLDTLTQMQNPPYDLPLPGVMSHQAALPIAMEQASHLIALEKTGTLKICTSTEEIRACLATGVIAAVMHMEGAEAIDEDLYALDVLYKAGLRSLGPVWSRPTIFGHGVPFRYPSTGDTGEGLTDAGFRLVKRCDELGIMLDVSHLNEKGFWDIAKTSSNPIVATHSNVHAICPHARNLTDDQLSAIKDSGGMVGLNFAVAFTRPDGAMNEDTELSAFLPHLDYLIEHLGEDHVGLGSDFDGAHIPHEMKDISDLGILRKVMSDHGYNNNLMNKLCNENWIRILDKVWK